MLALFSLKERSLFWARLGDLWKGQLLVVKGLSIDKYQCFTRVNWLIFEELRCFIWCSIYKIQLEGGK